jgi:hypothetical protein
MNFYYFGGVFDSQENLETASSLEKNNFAGVMYTYDSTQGDMFVRVARDIKPSEKIKYLIAIRPYTISPQYLQAISDSINEVDENRVQINFISGYIKDHEANINGIAGKINDSSHSVDRSKYLLDYIETLNNMSINKKPLDFYISTTNNYIFQSVKKYKNKMIMPYHIYKRGWWSDEYGDNSSMVGFDLKNNEVMIAMTPIIREKKEDLESLRTHALRPIWKKGETTKVVDDVEYFTYESFSEFIEMLEEDGIHSLLINAVPREEKNIIIPFIKRYTESKRFVGHSTNKEKNIL